MPVSRREEKAAGPQAAVTLAVIVVHHQGESDSAQLQDLIRHVSESEPTAGNCLPRLYGPLTTWSRRSCSRWIGFPTHAKPTMRRWLWYESIEVGEGQVTKRLVKTRHLGPAGDEHLSASNSTEAKHAPDPP